MKRTDSASSLTEKEHIRSLDLSANDLENIGLINKKSLLVNHLERLEKIELQQNRLTSVPKSLCEVMKCGARFKQILFPFSCIEGLTFLEYLD